jgi:hypothetical protein
VYFVYLLPGITELLERETQAFRFTRDDIGKSVNATNKHLV